jgi:P pilus assembly chaperone PapD
MFTHFFIDRPILSSVISILIVLGGLVAMSVAPIEQYPELAPPQEEKIEGAGVNLRLRLGIPVFVAPTALPYATLDYFDSMQIEDQLFMHLRNAGNTHVKVSEVRYLAPGKDTPDVESAVIYILAGQTGYVPVALSDARRGGKVTLVTDALGNMEYDLSPAN